MGVSRASIDCGQLERCLIRIQITEFEIKVAQESFDNSISKLIDHVGLAFPDTTALAAKFATLMLLRQVDKRQAPQNFILNTDTGVSDRESTEDLWSIWRDLPSKLCAGFIRKLRKSLVDDRFNRSILLDGSILETMQDILRDLEDMPTDILNDLFNWWRKLDYESRTDSLVLRDSLDSVLMMVCAKGRLRASFADPDICRLMVELADPQFGESIFDPCFGCADLLTAAVDYSRLGTDTSDWVYRLQLFGTEVDPQVALIGQARLMLSGIDNASFRLLDPVKEDSSFGVSNPVGKISRSNDRFQGFDVVLANPPMEIEVHDLVQRRVSVPTKDSSSLILQEALSYVRPGGRLVIAMPARFLYRGGPDREIRKLLVEQHSIDSVITVPQGGSAGKDRVKTAILSICRGGMTTSIRMVKLGSSFSYNRSFAAPEVSKAEAINHPIRTTFNEQIESDSTAVESWAVNKQFVKTIDYDLSVVRRNTSQLEKNLARAPFRQVVRLTELCDVFTGSSLTSDDLVELDAKKAIKAFRALKPHTYLTLDEAAAILAITPDDLASIRGAGKIRGVSNGVVWKFSAEDLWRLSEDHTEYLSKLQRQNTTQRGAFLIRSHDVRKGMITHGTALLTEAAENRTKASARLRSGDILLSRSAAIGKVGIVYGDAVGAIAANGFFVIRSRSAHLKPNYLLVYLQSEDVTSWLNDRASGSASRNLSSAVIKQLPVLVPSDDVQRAALEEQKGAMFVRKLVGIVRENENISPESAEVDWWISNTSRLVRTSKTERTRVSENSAIEHLLMAANEGVPVRVCNVCRQLNFANSGGNPHVELHFEQSQAGVKCAECGKCLPSHVQSHEAPLIPWLILVCDGMELLKNVVSIPDSIGMLSVVQAARGKFSDATASIGRDNDRDSEARQLSEELGVLIEKWIRDLEGNVHVRGEVVSARLMDGKEVEVEIAIENQSALPIRDFSFRLQPEIPATTAPSVAYLRSNDSLNFCFRGSDKRENHDGTFVLEWSGRSLNGKQITGSVELAVKVIQSTGSDAPAGDSSTDSMGGSPYVCGSPVKPGRSDVFFGREELLEQIKRQVSQSGNVVLLEGNRRAGKSSILWHLEGRDAVPEWLGVYCSLQGAEGDRQGGVPTAAVFRNMAYDVVQSMRKLNGWAMLPDGTILDADRKFGITGALRSGISDETPFNCFREYVESVLETLSTQNLGLLLLIDEFDKLQEGIDIGVTSPQVPENIRFLIQSYPRFSAILTGSRRLKRMREEYFSALFGLGTRLSVTSLQEDAAARLVTEPVKGQLAFAKDAVQLACYLTARQPYLLQCLCNRIFDLAAQRNVRSITTEHVRDAAKALVQDNEHFSSLWDYTGNDRRRFLLALLHREANGPNLMRLRGIEEKLEHHGIEVPEETLISDLESLYELELVNFRSDHSGTEYSLTIPMMGDWIESQPQADFDALRIRAQVESADSIT